VNCHTCRESAIILQPPRCKHHFIEDFEQRVKDTIERFDLIKPGQKIAVAASGGKDSLTVLHLLKKWYGDVTAIVVDEGIAGYREHTIRDLEIACQQRNIPIIRTSYEALTGFTLDQILKKHNLHPCTICGAFRRHLIAVASKPFDVLATGHNADDEAQTILMNLLRGNTDIFPRNGPKSGTGIRAFTQRVKPLYFVTEKEVMTYAFLNGFVTKFTECPNAQQGYRYLIRDVLNAYARDHPEVKEHILNQFLTIKEAFHKEPSALLVCTVCGEPSAQPTCKACAFVQLVKA